MTYLGFTKDKLLHYLFRAMAWQVEYINITPNSYVIDTEKLRNFMIHELN